REIRPLDEWLIDQPDDVQTCSASRSLGRLPASDVLIQPADNHLSLAIRILSVDVVLASIPSLWSQRHLLVRMGLFNWSRSTGGQSKRRICWKHRTPTLFVISREEVRERWL
ncbi:hypothetical protein FRC11_008869, partial [Ceratobasidium sp. 423]